MNNELRIHTHINSRYKVFDASGRLPFSIVFGLCRRSPADTDPRSVLFEIAGSVLDVLYALAHGYLTLHEQGFEIWNEVNVSRLNQIVPKETECLSLPSPVNRTQHWKNVFMIYQCHMNVNRKLTSILKPEKKHIIKLAGENLHVKRWAFTDRKQFDNENKNLGCDLEVGKLVNSKSSAGRKKPLLATDN